MCCMFDFVRIYFVICFQFLMACTAKLKLESYARVLYDWEGREISDLKDGKFNALHLKQSSRCRH